MDFLRRVYMKDTDYTDAVYADIKYLQKLHFLLYDELHSFLTERKSGPAGGAGAGVGARAGAGANGVNGQALAAAAMQ